MVSVRVGPFVLRKLLGTGGMGQVWRAEHVDSGRPVAVKLLTAEAARSGGLGRAFRNEVRASAGLDHPNLVRIHDTGVVGAAGEALRIAPESPWLAMELGAADLRTSSLRLSGWSAILDVLLQVLDGLSHAHARDLVHRDLKPENVLRFDEGPSLTWKLADFGIAHALEGGQEDVPRVVGTPATMAPEQIRGELRALGPWTDLYALGCVTWELVTGEPPFVQPDAVEVMRAHLYTEVGALTPRLPVPAGLEGWLGALLEKDPRDRPALAADAAATLRALGPAPNAEVAPVVGPDGPLTWGGTLAIDPIGALVPPASAPAPHPRPRSRTIPAMPDDWRGREGGRSAPLGVGLGLVGLRRIHLVGRTEERDALWKALRDVRRGKRPRMLLLRGPTGIGASRLAQWLCERAHESGAAVSMRATCDRIGGSGLHEMAVRTLRAEQLTDRAARSQVEWELGRRGVTDPDEVAPIAALVDPEHATVRLDSAGERDHALWTLLRATASGRAAICWLDDLQWGPEALAWASSLLDASPIPVLLVGTVRDDELPETGPVRDALDRLRAHPRTREIALGPLAPADHGALVRDLLGLEPNLAARIEERTAGNPLFAVHLVADQVDRGALVPSPTGYTLRAGAEVALPDDVHEAWRARVDGLLAGRPEAERHALELAAVLGQDVDAAVFADARSHAGLPAIPDLVELLLDHGLAVAARVEGWAFSHGMVREAIVREAEEAGRAAGWHRACAAAYASRGIEGSQGLHLLASGDAASAVLPLLRGVTRGWRTTGARQRLVLLGHLDAAVEQAGIAESDPIQARVWLARAEVRRGQGNTADVEALVGRVLDGAARFGWPEEEARARLLQGLVEMRRGRFDLSWELMSQALDHWEARAHVAGMSRALGSLATNAAYRGDAATLDRLMERMSALIDVGGGDDMHLADLVRLRAQNHLQRGAYDEAERDYALAAERFARLGRREGIAYALTGQADSLRHRGRAEEARALYERAWRTLRNAGVSAPFMRMNLAICDVGTGGWERAARMLAEVLAEVEPGTTDAGMATLWSLPCHAALGDRAAYEHAWRTIAGGAVPCPNDVDAATPLELAGDQAIARRWYGEARDAWLRAARMWDALGRTHRAATVRDRIGHG